MQSSSTATFNAAFEQSAGLTPHALQQASSAAFLALVFIWAAWIMLGTLQQMHQAEFTFVSLASRVFAVLMILSGSLVLVHHTI